MIFFIFAYTIYKKFMNYYFIKCLFKLPLADPRGWVPGMHALPATGYTSNLLLYLTE